MAPQSTPNHRDGEPLRAWVRIDPRDLARPDAAELALDGAAKTWLDGATEHAMSLSFDEYASHVVAYLEPSHADVYANRSAWETMQEDVAARLEAFR